MHSGVVKPAAVDMSGSEFYAGETISGRQLRSVMTTEARLAAIFES